MSCVENKCDPFRFFFIAGIVSIIDLEINTMSCSCKKCTYAFDDKNRDTLRATSSRDSMVKLMRAIIFRRLLRRRSIISENGTSNARPICIGTYKRYHTCNTQVNRRRVYARVHLSKKSQYRVIRNTCSVSQRK